MRKRRPPYELSFRRLQRFPLLENVDRPFFAASLPLAGSVLFFPYHGRGFFLVGAILSVAVFFLLWKIP